MENKEFTYQGKTLNGILMLVLNIIGFLAVVGLFIFACVSQEGWLAMSVAFAVYCFSS